ncbi:MORN repeat-containing protein [Azospirillum thermophilum]|uniref:MORN motif-containing protein n=1 Tax=Azospirillum thermophilum TaxID=2202148 RepID=A0A2S2CQI9_9PROT|nr:hypothetical protein [Azospirillum thermophilum]AWK86729.1 hypothetical protein DEW08_11195 [Azospirillum thermophilum]
MKRRVWPAGSALAALVTAALMTGAPFPAAAGGQVVKDTNQGCLVWDLYPDPRKSVSWDGPCKDGYADGQGVLSWFTDGKLQGRQSAGFVAGRAQGDGEVQWENGRRFTGSFRDGVAEGRGSFTWPDGRRYDGEWAGDHRTGHGTLTLGNGDRYVGRFERNRPTGEGEYVTAGGARFTALVDKDWTVRPGTPLDPAKPAPVAAPAPAIPAPAVPSIAGHAVPKPPVEAKPAPLAAPVPVKTPAPAMEPKPPVAVPAPSAAPATAVPVAAGGGGGVDPRTQAPPPLEPISGTVGRPLSLKQ